MSFTVLKPVSRRDEAQIRVLRYLTQNPSASQRDMSSALGVSLGLVNFCLNALVEKGLIKISNFRAADNKIRYAYVLTPSGLSEKLRLTNAFLQRKLEEYEALKGEIELLRSDLEDEQVAQF